MSKMATLKKTKNGFQDQLSLICRSKVLQNAPKGVSAILSTFIKLAVVIKTFVLSMFEWPFNTGFTVLTCSVLQWVLVNLCQLLPRIYRRI